VIKEERTMLEQSVSVEWVCQRCGGSGVAKVVAGMCNQGFVSQLVLSHSLACNGCDGDPRTYLRWRPDCYSDADWQRAKEKARSMVAAAHHKEPVPMVPAESRYSATWLQERLSGEPRWDDFVRAARYLR
jgi:hypothetical protein